MHYNRVNRFTVLTGLPSIANGRMSSIDCSESKQDLTKAFPVPLLRMLWATRYAVRRTKGLRFRCYLNVKISSALTTVLNMSNMIFPNLANPQSFFTVTKEVIHLLRVQEIGFDSVSSDTTVLHLITFHTLPVPYTCVNIHVNTRQYGIEVMM